MNAIEEAVHGIAGYLSLILDALAVLMVAVGAVGALAGMYRAFAGKQASGQDMRSVFIHFARWLVAALTFQLGADIIGTTIAPTWDELGRLASIALIRTFLTYFLDRDLEKAHLEWQAQQGESSMRQTARAPAE